MRTSIGTDKKILGVCEQVFLGDISKVFEKQNI